MEKRYVYCRYRPVHYLLQVQLVTKDDSRTIRVIERDSMGRYYVTVPREIMVWEDYYLGVGYRKDWLFRGNTTDASSSVSCYKSYELELPSLIKDCVEECVPLGQKLEALCQLFKNMTYDK